jgi:hypothetical protein
MSAGSAMPGGGTRRIFPGGRARVPWGKTVHEGMTAEGGRR